MSKDLVNLLLDFLNSEGEVNWLSCNTVQQISGSKKLQVKQDLFLGQAIVITLNLTFISPD